MQLPVHARKQRRALRGGRADAVDAMLQRLERGVQALQQTQPAAEITQARLDFQQHRMRRRLDRGSASGMLRTVMPVPSEPSLEPP